MQRLVPTIARTVFGLGVVFCAAQSAQAAALMPRDKEIALALEAAPESLRAGAAVYVFGAGGYEKVRDGANGLSCLVNRDGNQAGDETLHPSCWDAEGGRTILPVALRVGELIARAASADEIKQDIEAGFGSGKFVSPGKAGVCYMLRGDVRVDFRTGEVTRTVFPPHYMIYAPGVGNADIGMGRGAADSRYALPSVFAGYSGGARTAYIIVPAAPAGVRPY